MGLPTDIAENVAGVVAAGTSSVAGRELARQKGQKVPGVFDIYTHTVDGLASRMESAVNDPASVIFGDPAQMARVDAAMAPGQWQSSSFDQWIDSAIIQQDALAGQWKEIADAKGALPTIGAVMGLLTSVEQMISTALSVIPFPAFPAVRITDVAVGLPHAHPHPPNLTPPNPVPVPLPSMGPLIPIPLLSGASQTLINGMPAARCGDMGIGVWCGGYAPMYEVFLGSSNVWIEGNRAARLAVDITKHCIFADPPIGPPFGMTISSSPNVLIGGVPMPSLLNLAMGAAIKGLFKGVGALAKKIGGTKTFSRLATRAKSVTQKVSEKARQLGKAARNRIQKAMCVVTGHPVDVATGKVFTDRVDLELPGPIPFKWECTWYSTSSYDGPLGHGWHHSYDMGIEVEDEITVVRMGDGRFVACPLLEVGQEHFERTERFTIFRDGQGYGIVDARRLYYRFAEIVENQRSFALVEITDQTGSDRLRLNYDAEGRLQQLRAATGQVIELAHDGQGRIVEMTAPHGNEANARFVVVQYAYDELGNLAVVTDAHRHATRYRYENHLLVQETDRNGLSFYFEYDAEDESARCVHTWGDGGIYDHRLSYDDLLGITTVENSLGFKTEYQHQGGLVTCTTDANGAATVNEYNEHNQIVRRVDALGNETTYAYDDRGNTIKVVSPDGASVEIHYDRFDSPVEAVDALGGVWTWQYDEFGRLLAREDPLGQGTRFQYDGSALRSVTGPAGEITRLRYNAAGYLETIEFPDGGVCRWTFDHLGRPVRMINALGAVQERVFDSMGRLVRVAEPDGNLRELAYDAEGNVITAKDRQHEVSFSYQGVGRLVERFQNGVAVRFRYDTEEQLVAIANEDGEVYRFELDPAGRVCIESGFDGAHRNYERDPLGRISKVRRPGGVESHFEYDAAGRVTQVEHSDGSREHYSYRVDGELVEAGNDAAVVSFDRDALGRVVREQNGDHWVASEYDVLGLRCKMESSLGAIQEIDRNAMGDVLGISGSFSARFERDRLGQELSRGLPGGVRSRWQRDSIGRPLAHEVWSGQQKQRDVRYSWDVNGRLTQLLDASRGPIRFGHDPLGNLAWALYPDGSREWRVPDRVGNLYRTEHRDDRKYGPAGQLLEATDEDGRVTRYEYDADGNLLRKRAPFGQVWRYHWNAAGMLERVDRPDGRRVWFTYDALGRRLSKTFRGKTTRWVWDGNNPLHEWVEDAPAELSDETWDVQEHAAPDSPAEDEAHRPRGPPREQTPYEDGDYLSSAASEQSPVTWLFEPESFAPLARIEGNRKESVVTDHLGTPVAMLDESGNLTWSARLDTYGAVRELEKGSRGDCPFRFPGQYEDEETGLHYNRFRYYDPDSGQYVSQDPVGVAGGRRPYAYVSNPESSVDVFGLAGCKTRLGLGLKNRKLGLDYGAWSEQNGFKTYGELSGRGPFSKQIKEAMDAADEIHFNLDGVDPSRANARLNEFDEPAAGYTNYELAQIRDNPAYKAKTTWYKDGEALPEGFDPFE